MHSLRSFVCTATGVPLRTDRIKPQRRTAEDSSRDAAPGAGKRTRVVRKPRMMPQSNTVCLISHGGGPPGSRTDSPANGWNTTERRRQSTAHPTADRPPERCIAGYPVTGECCATPRPPEIWTGRSHDRGMLPIRCGRRRSIQFSGDCCRAACATAESRGCRLPGRWPSR